MRYKVIFFGIDGSMVAGVKAKLDGLRRVDLSFRYSIVEGYKGGYIVIVFEKEKDTAYKRAAWLWDKVFDRKCGYVVR